MGSKLSLGIIGWGNMGSSLGAVIGCQPDIQLIVYDKDTKKLKQKSGFRNAKSAAQVISASSVVILSIKPQDVRSFLEETREEWLKNKPLLITICAGIKTDFFIKKIGRLPVVRVMPNLAAACGCSMSFVAAGAHAGKIDVHIAAKLFSLAGEVIVTGENMIDKATAISGSGPGFIFSMMNSFYGQAVKLGFNAAQARMMVNQTFLGAATLAKQNACDFKKMVTAVASRGGTTEAGLKVMRAKKIDAILKSAVGAAWQRGIAISEEVNKSEGEK